jgi:glycosyltransferase involved in cell wall biosynthesis
MMQKRVTILHIITTLDIGGAQMMLLRLLTRTNAQRFSNHVVCLSRRGDIGKEIVKLGVPVYALDMPKGRLTVTGLSRLARVLRSVRPVVVQTWLYHADLLGTLFGKLFRIPHICWNIRCAYHDFRKYRWSTKWTMKMCAFLSSIPDIVVTNAVAGRQFHIESGYRTRRWEIIPNGFDLERFKPDEGARTGMLRELGLENGKGGREDGRRVFLIGYIARHDPMKDHPTFIEAARLLLEQKKPVHFILAGKGVQWENELLVSPIPRVWRDRFHLLGERKDIEKVTAALHIASSASFGEGFPNVIGEAMACAVPCVVTDVGDSARIVGDTGRVVPPKDPQALAGAWSELIELGDEGRRALGAAARQRVQEHFEIHDVVRQYEALYASLVTRGKDTP